MGTMVRRWVGAARLFSSSPRPRYPICSRPVLSPLYRFSPSVRCLYWYRPSARLFGEKPYRLDRSDSGTYQSVAAAPSERSITSTPSRACTIVNIRENGIAIELSIGTDGDTALFHATWLWMNQPDFVHPTSGQRLVSSPSSALGWTIHSAKIVDTPCPESGNEIGSGPLSHPPPACLHPTGSVYGSSTASTSAQDRNLRWLQVEWTRQVGNEKTPQQHITHHSWIWLERCRYDVPASAPSSETCIRDDTSALRRDSSLTEVEYREVMESDSACFTLLDAVFHQGAAIVRFAPPGDTRDNVQHEAKTVSELGRRLSGGRLSHGHLYGDTFHVQSVPNAINLAYTSTPLPPHQDLAYYQSPPGLQLLHCVSNRVTSGGESTLIDAISAAEQLKKWMPEKLDALTRCCATFVKQRESADIVFRAPHVQVTPTWPTSASAASEARNASLAEVVAVRWAPPFQGPVLIDPEHLNDYWTAYMCYERMIDNALPTDPYLQPCGIKHEDEQNLITYAHQHTWERRLEEGEILIFNNQRILHGRRGFQLSANPNGVGASAEISGDAGRHFIGCYTNMEDTLSRYRLLWRQQGSDDSNHSFIPAVGNGSTGIRLA